ncbi:unnamed protein product [Phaedon cochleariae]|uniref:PHD-type domain-containing protein n=1 Tax=Phaedon cochleariae TaxID=80249 RepID=A0A9N9SCQ9_PHACE|nr:unnamed protein product [Phaedon cochleariae]
MAIILKNQYLCKNVDASLRSLLSLVEKDKINRDTQFVECNSIHNDIDIKYEYDDKQTGLHKMSTFYKHFLKIFMEISVLTDSVEGNNIYHSKTVVDIILLKYMPFCSLWTGIILKYKITFLKKSRENVLALFKEWKLNIPKTRLTKQPSIKIKDPASEHIAEETWKKRGNVLPTHFSGNYLKRFASQDSRMETEIVKNNVTEETIQEKCIYCGYGQLDVTADWVACDSCNRWLHLNCDPYSTDKTYGNSIYICESCKSDRLQSKENDKNKCLHCNLSQLDVTADWVCCDGCDKWLHLKCDPSSSDKTYSGSYYCESCTVHKQLLLEDTINCSKCLYCGLGQLDETAEWVSCDKCNGWVHKACDRRTKEPNFSTDSYHCKNCSIKEFKMKCQEFLVKLENGSNSHDRDEIEANTRGQRKCARWFAERKIRLTASNFGRICKCKSDSGRIKIVKELITQGNRRNVAMKHGIKYEKTALDEYLSQNGYQHIESGLIVHKTFPFLAGSPDGLLGVDGTIEIKCPFKIKNKHPDNAFTELDYMYNDGTLKLTSKHYYQIQDDNLIVSTFPHNTSFDEECTTREIIIQDVRLQEPIIINKNIMEGSFLLNENFRTITTEYNAAEGTNNNYYYFSTQVENPQENIGDKNDVGTDTQVENAVTTTMPTSEEETDYSIIKENITKDDSAHNSDDPITKLEEATIEADSALHKTYTTQDDERKHSD